MANTVFSVLIKKCQDHADALSDSLAHGKAKSFEEYKEACGSIRGLEYAIKEIEDLSRNYEDSIDE